MIYFFKFFFAFSQNLSKAIMKGLFSGLLLVIGRFTHTLVLFAVLDASRTQIQPLVSKDALGIVHA